MQNRLRPEGHKGKPGMLIHPIGVNQLEFRPQGSGLLRHPHAPLCDLKTLL